MKSLLLAACSLLALLAPAGAQEKRSITYRTLCFDYINNVKSVHLATAADTTVDVPLYTESISRPVQAEVKGGTAFFSVAAELPKPGQKEGVLSANLPPSASKVLFLFLPNPGSATNPYVVMAMADDFQSFPLGTVKLLNLTPSNVRFDLGEFSEAQGVVVGPGKFGSVGSVKKVNHLNAYDAVALYQLPDKKFAAFYNSRWRSVAGKRDLAIAYIDPKSKAPNVNIYEDAPPAVIPDPKPQ